MATRETIAIVGATGKAGQALAHKLAAAGKRVLLLSRDAEKLDTLAGDIVKALPNADIEVLQCMKDGCWEADIIVLAVPEIAEAEVAGRIKEVATQKAVVHLLTAENAAGFPAARMRILQQLLPFSHIVTVVINKAKPAELTVTGENMEAVNLVTTIAETTGFKVQIAAEL